MLIFLDIETTGLEEEDKICSIGVISVDENGDIKTIYELLNEGKKIPPKASSIHHITNEMIKDKCSFMDSESYKFLQEHNDLDTTIIAHNVNFDIQKLLDAGFKYKGAIVDTLKVVKHLIPECELFSLQILRYELKLYLQEESHKQECGIKDALVAHNAISDALVVKLLYNYMLDIASLDEMYELSMKKVLLEKFSFGKYQGRYIEDIAYNDRAYISWMLNLPDLDEDMRYSLEYHLQG